jgi:hypothetical protein
MEAFFDPKNNKPVDQIEVKQGETKVIGLRKFNLNDVAVRSQDFKVAFCDKAIQLKDKTKKAYNNHYNLNEVVNDTAAVESHNSLYFQICGNGSGSTEVTARFTNNAGSVAYANPVAVKVTENKKRLNMTPAVPFDTLWTNHPLNPQNRGLYNDDPEHPCHQSTWLVGQCMVRFCTALDKSGISIDGLVGRKCGLGGRDHKYHFIDPNDFERWKGLRDGYAWEAKAPLQPEPMPGIAAYYFTMSRRGVILFENYFPTDPKKGNMLGGHIDLWNRNRMGNTFAFSNPTDGLAAFARARKIVFWPLE